MKFPQTAETRDASLPKFLLGLRWEARWSEEYCEYLSEAIRRAIH
jgi:hypothetical protein